MELPIVIDAPRTPLDLPAFRVAYVAFIREAARYSNWNVTPAGFSEEVPLTRAVQRMHELAAGPHSPDWFAQALIRAPPASADAPCLLLDLHELRVAGSHSPDWFAQALARTPPDPADAPCPPLDLHELRAAYAAFIREYVLYGLPITSSGPLEDNPMSQAVQQMYELAAGPLDQSWFAQVFARAKDEAARRGDEARPCGSPCGQPAGRGALAEPLPAGGSPRGHP